MGKIRHKCKIFVGKAEGGDRLEDLCIRGSRRVDYVGVNWVKCREFLDHLNEYLLLKRTLLSRISDAY